MRRRSGGGGGGGGGQLSQELRRYVYGFKQLGSATEDDVVEHLRSKHPRFLRLKVETLRSLVRKTLADSPSHRPNKRPQSPPLTFDGGDDDDEEEEGPGGEGASRNKRRRGDEGEERLRRMENARLRRVRRSGESEESEESESSDDNGDGAVSTSEDAVYGEKLEPKFDLMKSMLRDSYKEKERPKEKEKNVELEVPGPEKAAMKRPLVPVPGGEAKRERGRSSSSIGGGGDEGSKGSDGEGPRFRDLGGMKEVLEELEMEVLVPLCHPQLPRWLGVRPLSGILLNGPPGCGKTKLAHAIANETGVPFYKISATEVVSGVSGASEENIRELFLKAQRTAPSIIFIDEIDAIASKRENLQREMERRIVTQLMTCMDESHRLVKPSDGNSGLNAPESTPGYVLVIGATNRPDALDPALRRPGRFDREIALRMPDENARVEILSVLAKELRLEGSFDLLKIARSTPGFVGADLMAVANKAGNLSMKRIANERKSEISKNGENEEHNELWWKEPWLPEEMEKLSITMADFEEAVKMVQPSSKREGFSDIPNKKWEDVGGLDHLRQEFERYIVRRIKYPEDYEGFGVDMETGFLLYGPPGCGKTLIAKAVANEAGANFIHVKGPELLNKYVGDSELAVRILFTRARTCSPCIIFFDEVDALTTKRGKEGGWVVERLLNQLLVELDGAEQRHGVYVIGATNRPEMMDKAILRPGRFGKLLYVPLPSPHQRSLILQAVAREKPIDASVDLNAIAQMEACENFSGADLAALVNEAGMTALEEKQRSTNSAVMSYAIKTTHFELAMKKIAPSVTIPENQYYEALSKTFKSV